MRNLTAGFLIVMLFVTSCKDNTAAINRLSAQLQGVTDTLNICLSARNYCLKRIDTLNNFVQANFLEIYRDSLDMVKYLSNHQTAVACIAGGYVGAQVKTDFGTKYPEIVEDLAGLGIVVAIGYYLFNQEEVEEVLRISAEADARKKLLYSEISKYQQKISEERTYLANITNVETTCQNRAFLLRQQIEDLK